MIDVWLGYFSTLNSADYHPLLSPDEIKRAERFIDANVRERFIIGRGMLRQILSQYINIPPEDIAFIYGTKGKPHLLNHPIHFNLSHSYDMLMLAVSPDKVIGADIEYQRPMDNMATVARMNFSPYEQSVFFNLPDDEKVDAFYALWTRKEAYIKAVGDGFALPLSGFDITLDDHPRLLRSLNDDVNQWHFSPVAVGKSYSATVCMTAPTIEINIMRFS
jgi:4'-phosphopantetheinyl transferase